MTTPQDIDALADAIEADVTLGTVRAEVGYAYHPELGTVRPVQSTREPRRPGELRGWIDIEIVTPSSVIIADWKSACDRSVGITLEPDDLALAIDSFRDVPRGALPGPGQR